MTALPDPFERRYSAADADRGLLHHVLPVLGYPMTLWQHRYLLQNFFRRELLGRFRGSVFGVVWVILPARPWAAPTRSGSAYWSTGLG